MNNRFWKNKKVLVTGHEGFLGSNLTRYLLSCGSKVVGLDIETKRKNTTLTKDDYRKITTVRGNVANYTLLKKILLRNKIEYVFHLAAEALVEKCNTKPLRAFSSNIEGTWKLLEACRIMPGIKAVVIASSDKAYGSHKKLPYKEDASLIGNHPYDVSKSCADLIAYTYYHTYQLPVAVTRCGNIFGPGDLNFSRIIPDAIKCALANKQLQIRSDGKFTRDYVYVDDIVKGYILIAQNMKKLKLSGESFNFSYEHPISVIDLLSSINKLAKAGVKYKILNKAVYEIKHQYLSARKARRVLGWKPEYNLTQGLKKTIAWYQDHLGCK